MVKRSDPPARGPDDEPGAAAAGDGADELAPGTPVGEYCVERKIGEGGMGTVYGAIHPMIGKRAAIKLLRPELSVNPEAVERFLGEARAVNQIGHANIVDVFSFGVLADGRRYFVMEWLTGQSLAQRLDAGGRLALADACQILDQVILALAAAHARGIVHRDLKPDNVFLCDAVGEPIRVKLLDFGIAKLIGEPIGIKRTKTGALMGTPGYIAPEQARGEDIDARADLYALGAMAFEMVTGRLPFESGSAMVIISKHLTEDPPAPSTIAVGAALPAELDDLILGMMAKDRADRPDLDEIRDRVRALGGLAPVGPAAEVPRRTHRAKGPSRAPTLAAVSAPTLATTATLAAPAVGPAITLAPDDDHAAAPATRRARPRWWLAGAGLVAAATIAVIATAGGRPAARSQPPAVAPPVVAPPAAVADPTPPVVPPDPPPAVAAGRLALVVNGSRDAVVAIDGAAHALTDGALAVELAAGAHALVVTARKMKPVRQTLAITAGQALTIEVTLVADRAAGTRIKPGGTTPVAPPPDDDALVDPFRKKVAPPR